MPVWKQAMGLATDIFRLTDNLPRKEDYGFTSQIRRAALSISANIAEGYGRQHNNDKTNFYYYARGSATESQNHLEYGLRVAYFKKDEVEKLDRELSEIYQSLNKMIIALHNVP